ncbi:MAG: hypothetical protein [Olavius algarvensis Delta 4 endosymbiont]|nr:MAG: hypothetical protein [Olavius algarvensis Delta 4 endosymbiont]
MMNNRLFKFLLNIYPPYIGAGIRIRKVAPDFREIVVQMRLRWYNRNYFNTHFGGSLYAMVDPFYCLMLVQVLGKDYIVWDQAAPIEFKNPGGARCRRYLRLVTSRCRRFCHGLLMAGNTGRSMRLMFAMKRVSRLPAFIRSFT